MCLKLVETWRHPLKRRYYLASRSPQWLWIGVESAETKSMMVSTLFERSGQQVLKLCKNFSSTRWQTNSLEAGVLPGLGCFKQSPQQSAAHDWSGVQE